MSVFSRLHRFRVPIFLFIFCLMAVLLHSNKLVDNLFLAVSSGVDRNTTLTSKINRDFVLTKDVGRTVLDNGLTVLTKEVHNSPVVSLQVWYKVGSLQETPGINGIAHQLEHIMFKGTTNRPIQFGRLLTALGSDWNAFTSYDQTAYYGTVESNKLKALLELEADRMENALIDAEALATEKRVVISELQGYENNPDYRLSRAVMKAAFPNHPYGLPVGGTKADVEKFQLQQVKEYYRNYYSPDNAVLVIVGDFDTAKTLKDVKEIFGKIPPNQKSRVEKNKHLPLKNQSGSLFSASSSKVILREPGGAGLLHGVYPLPDVNHPDIPALDVMDYILSEGRNSRLQRALVESGLASEVKTYVNKMLAGGWYEVIVTANANSNLSKLDSVVKDAIAKVAAKGVTRVEVSRAKAQLEAEIILNNRDITSQAMQLGNDEITSGDYRYTDRYLAAMTEVTAADVQRVAKKYLKKELRTVGFFEPNNTRTIASASIKSNTKTPARENLSAETTLNTAQLAKYLPTVDFTSTPITQQLPQKFTLSNGLRLLLLPDSSTPTITLSGYIKAGKEFDPKNKAGLASLVADNLMNGTKTKDALDIAKTLENRGVTLNFKTYTEALEIQGNSLASDLPILMRTLADVVQNPTFPHKELELSRKQALTNLKQELDDPAEVARRTFFQSVYPENHPLHNFPTQKSWRRIRRQDVINFAATHYRPETTVLVLTGDFAPQQVHSLIAEEFENWQVNTPAPKLDYPDVPVPDTVVRVNPVIPGKTQAITYIGNTGIKRENQQFYAVLVLNQILGGDTISSRLGAEIRDRQGLTYGIYSDMQAGKNFGIFSIEMQTAPEDANQAIASTRKLLEDVYTRGVTAAEVETAKQTLIGNYNVSLAKPEELTSKVLWNQLYGLKPKELRDFTQKIKKVTLEEVNQAARELLDPNKIVVVTAGSSVLADKGDE
ncbi:MAG: pitrilysin family protein [Nostocaceae cyanobacterium]|nr:pitrilysin family protein [Nostocaceae cyanobacterium]